MQTPAQLGGRTVVTRLMVTAVRGRAGLARACAGVLAAVALVTVWLALQIGGRQTSLWVDDVSTPAAAALALGSACAPGAGRRRTRAASGGC